MWSEYAVNHLLNIDWEVSIAHDSDIECLLTSVRWDCEFMLILWFNLSLIEEESTIHYEYVVDFLYSSENIYYRD